MTLVIIAGICLLLAGWQRWNAVAAHIAAIAISGFDTFSGASRVMNRGEVLHGNALLASFAVISAILIACYWLARSFSPSPKAPQKQNDG